MTKKEFERYLNIRKINGITDLWLYDIKKYVTDFLKYIDWIIDEDLSLKYFNKIRNKYSITSYRKQIYQIRKFLKYLDIEWVKNIIPPAEPQYLPKRITKENIKNTISHFKENELYIKIKTLILLGATTGVRAHELYQLNIEDINLKGRIVYINHNPKNGQSTKTKRSRISFFNKETKKSLIEYFKTSKEIGFSGYLFSERHIQHLFEKAPIKVKDLRKFFSQEWDRRGGPTSIKKILMGHSLKGDVDLMHYNAQSEEDLKMIYEKVMEENIII